MNTTETNVRRRLKSETASAHKKLDEMMSARGPFDSVENYQWYLSGMRVLCRYCEPSIEWVEKEAGLGGRERSLVELIDSDLATVSNAPAPAGADFSTSLHALSVPSRWAQTYVLEGSAVGASYMIKGARMKLPPGLAVKFLTQLASDARQRWPVFVEALTESNIDADEAVTAACGVFELACRVFSSPTPEAS